MPSSMICRATIRIAETARLRPRLLRCFNSGDAALREKVEMWRVERRAERRGWRLCVSGAVVAIPSEGVNSSPKSVPISLDNPDKTWHKKDF